uniref:Uncharacterized protein n=1 Tax=Setaria viridis TaxID=4556 RepID=A0A4U6V5H5_SETVI|nr:hypothetical protein SEVIR_3G046450v2 [Setaria viridis]
MRTATGGERAPRRRGPLGGVGLPQLRPGVAHGGRRLGLCVVAALRWSAGVEDRRRRCATAWGTPRGGRLLQERRGAANRAAGGGALLRAARTAATLCGRGEGGELRAAGRGPCLPWRARRGNRRWRRAAQQRREAAELLPGWARSEPGLAGSAQKAGPTSRGRKRCGLGCKRVGLAG